MTHQRPEPRFDSNLPVRVFGMTAQGKPFVKKARTQNISRNGALVSGIDVNLNIGDTIGVQLEQKKARFRVVWISAGITGKYQVGLQMQDGQESPWTTVLPGQQAPSEKTAKRRRRPRHRIPLNIELRDLHGMTLRRLWANNGRWAGTCGSNYEQSRCNKARKDNSEHPFHSPRSSSLL